MPQDTQNIPAAPKLDPGFDYAELPDHSYAQFKKGTSPEQMKAMLMSKGLLKTQQQTTQPSKPEEAGRPISGAPKSTAYTWRQPFGLLQQTSEELQRVAQEQQEKATPDIWKSGKYTGERSLLERGGHA